MLYGDLLIQVFVLPQFRYPHLLYCVRLSAVILNQKHWIHEINIIIITRGAEVIDPNSYKNIVLNHLMNKHDDEFS